MKVLLKIMGVCIVIATILPGTASASTWNVTFTAESVSNVGRIDDGETIFQGDPDLFFAMQIEVHGNPVTQVFYEGSYVSTTNWDFPDESVSLSTSSTLPPTVRFSFWLFDDDFPFGNPDLLGSHSFSTNTNMSSSVINNNIKWGTLPDPLTYEGSGWSNNYLLDYSVSFEVVPIPPAIWLFGSGLIGLIGVSRRNKG